MEGTRPTVSFSAPSRAEMSAWGNFLALTPCLRAWPGSHDTSLKRDEFHDIRYMFALPIPSYQDG